MVPSYENQDPIIKCFQSLHHVFRLIVKSRQLFSLANHGSHEDNFMSDIRLLFHSFDKMLSFTSGKKTRCIYFAIITSSCLETVLPTQTSFLLNLSSAYPSLLEVVAVLDLSKLVTQILGRLLSQSHHQIRRAALKAWRAAVNSPLWCDSPSRVHLLPFCLDLLSEQLQRREETGLAADIILDILVRLKLEEDKGRSSVFHRSVELLAESAIVGPLGVAIVAEQEVSGSEEVEVEGVRLTTCLVGILEVVTMLEGGSVWQDTAVLGKLFTVLAELLARPNFPSDWSSYSASLLLTVQRTVQQSASCLASLANQQAELDKLLWMNFFRLAAAFILSPLVAVENMRDGRASSQLEAIASLRLAMTRLIESSWASCPDQIQLVPSLVGPLLELILVPVRDIRQTVVTVLISMMEVEQKLRGNFKQMETELIDKLDILINENREDEEYHEVFNSLMLDLTQQLSPSHSDSLSAAFVSSVSTLLERLLDYRGTLQGEHNRNKRMTCTVNLLKFYKDDITRQELHTRYVYRLRDLHIQCHNYAEAAFTLALHASQLDWSTRMLHEDQQFPIQQEWQRKEQLYGQMIALFDQSQLWECSVPLCKELADLYENRIYDYHKLSNILDLQAAAYRNILSTFRPSPEYFKVSFLGSSFPLFVRNKEFIYRGLEFEKLADFSHRLCQEFPEAELFTKVLEEHSLTEMS